MNEDEPMNLPTRFVKNLIDSAINEGRLCKICNNCSKKNKKKYCIAKNSYIEKRIDKCDFYKINGKKALDRGLRILDEEGFGEEPYNLEWHKIIDIKWLTD